MGQVLNPNRMAITKGKGDITILHDQPTPRWIYDEKFPDIVKGDKKKAPFAEFFLRAVVSFSINLVGRALCKCWTGC